MICPRCGSRNCASDSDPIAHLHHLECYECGKEWDQSYDPSLIREREHSKLSPEEETQRRRLQEKREKEDGLH